MERGDVKPRIGEVFPLDEAREAQDASQKGRVKGKNSTKGHVRTAPSQPRANC